MLQVFWNLFQLGFISRILNSNLGETFKLNVFETLL